MLTRTQPVMSRMDVVDSLARFREEWQACIDGESLINVQASADLMHGDVVMMIGLTKDKQVAVLGEELRREFIQYVRYRNNWGIQIG